jgi:peptidoglycan/xylan/chitin deacetylase (PgdA/CDA1 family)
VGEGRPYREPAPQPADLVRWPDAFGTRFIVFVDVEEEFDWRAPLDRRHRATTAMRAFLPAHRRFRDRGVALTCMVDYPIACDPAAVEVLARAAEDGRTEVGTQLHAWVNPPFGDGPEPYPGALPAALEGAKLDRLTDAITAAFGRRPRAYRAGRYGIGPNTRALLAARGYRLDSSVRARYDYSADGGPDFRAVGNHAYRAAGVVELPLTTAFTGWGRPGGAGLYDALGRVPHGRGMAARAGLIERVALTPEDMPLPAALRALDAAVEEGVRLLVFSFHSPSLAPGHTPYVRDADDLAAFHGWWAAVLARLGALGVANASLAEVIAAAG